MKSHLPSATFVPFPFDLGFLRLLCDSSVIYTKQFVHFFPQIVFFKLIHIILMKLISP